MRTNYPSPCSVLNVVLQLSLVFVYLVYRFEGKYHVTLDPFRAVTRYSPLPRKNNFKPALQSCRSETEHNLCSVRGGDSKAWNLGLGISKRRKKVPKLPENGAVEKEDDCEIKSGTQGKEESFKNQDIKVFPVTTKEENTQQTRDENLEGFNEGKKLEEPSNTSSSASTISTNLNSHLTKADQSSSSKNLKRKRLVMILDVDGTLYPPGGDHVLELEIIRRIHKHCAEHYGISSQECDRLHREFGSTIDGLRVTKSLSTDNINFFYEDVYGNIDVRWLLSTTTSPQKKSKNGGDSKPKIPYTSHISSSPLDINEEDEMENEEFEDIDEETWGPQQ